MLMRSILVACLSVSPCLQAAEYQVAGISGDSFVIDLDQGKETAGYLASAILRNKVWQNKKDWHQYLRMLHSRSSLKYLVSILQNDQEFTGADSLVSGKPYQYLLSQSALDESSLQYLVKNGSLTNINCHIPAALASNKRFITDAIDKSDNALFHASEDLKNDRELVMMAVSKSAKSLRFASQELRSDREIALAAIKKNGAAAEFISRSLQSEKGFMTEAVKLSPSALRFASTSLRNDRDVVFDSNSLRYASDDLRANRDFVREMLGREGANLKFALDFANDRELVFTAIRQNGMSLEFASTTLQNDRELVLGALTKLGDGLALQFASSQLRDDKQVVLRAVLNDRRSFEFASKRLKKDPQILELVSKK